MIEKITEQDRYAISNKKLPLLCIRFEDLCNGFLVGLFLLPSYFGIRVGFFDLTALRFFELLILYMLFRNPIKRKRFIKTVFGCKQTIFIVLFFLVVVFTNIIRMSFGGIFYFFFNWILVFYIMLYMLKYTFSIQDIIRKIVKYTWVLVTVSPIEIILKKSPFAFLDTLTKSNMASRFGSIRIMGNCTTANGYGLLLMLLLPVICIDLKEKRVDLFANKWLVILIAINAILTGSRLAIGVLFLEIFLIFIFSSIEVKKKLLFWACLCVAVIISFIVLFPDFPFISPALRMFFSAVDALAGTSYALQYGANAKVLHDSTYYREILWKNTFGGGWLNPWIGRGSNYVFSMYVEGYQISSIDNYYVWQYIYYAYPGLISWGIMSFSFLFLMIRSRIKHRNIVSAMVIVAFIGYYVSLWYLDQLQTFPVMISFFAVACSINDHELHAKKL